MARKKDVVKKIDQKTKNSGAPLPLIQEDQPTPPAFAVIPAPDTLIEVSQAIQRSTQAPLVLVAISWNEAPNINPDYYNVDVSETADFTNKIRRRALSTSATIDGLKANGFTYYMRVQAVIGGIYSDFSNTLEVLTMLDDTKAPDVTSLSAQFINGDLLISWVKPLSEIFKDAEIRIYNAAHTIHYATLYSANQQIIWSAESNLAATSQTGVTSVSIDVYSRSWSNVLSDGVNTTATSAAPATPAGYGFNWIGDTGLASADLVGSWNRSSDAESYDLSFDGHAYQTRDTWFTYSYAQNVADHTPTLASGDPNIGVLLYARNKLGQQSVPVNVTVANLAPPSGVMSVTPSIGFSTVGVTVALLGSTIIQDFDHFEYALTSGSTTVQSFNSPDSSVIFQVSQAGTYSVSVKAVDKFNQKSPAVTVAGLVLDTLTIEQLRAETQYTDSVGTAANVLARLKDGVLYDGSGAYQFYGASAGYKWLMASRPLYDRYKTITFSAFWGSDFGFYLQVGSGVYYSGPATPSAVDPNSLTLTRYTNQTLAQTNAYFFGSSGNGTKRLNLTQIEEAKDIVLWFTNPTNAFGIYEFYPRRLVQSDDIEAESIRSINIAALGINADRIFATSLSAFTASMGSLHIDSLLDIATNGIIFQGTGTGTLAQNAATPTSFNVTGLKIYQVGGVGRLATYNAGVEQVSLDTDGKFKAGGGNTLMDANGLSLFVNNSWARSSGGIIASRTIKFKSSFSGGDIGLISAADYNGAQAYNYFDIMAVASASRYGRLHLGANTTNSFTDAFIELNGGANIANTSIQMWATNIDIVGFSTNRPTISIGDSLAGTNADIFLYGTTTNTGNLVVNGNIYWGTGGNYLSAYLNQALLTTSNPTFNKITASNGTSIFGNQAVDYLPTTGNWSSGGTTLLVQGNDFSSIGFHDSGSRVDFIVGGGGILRVGYDGGWGPAVVTMPGGARIGPNGVYIGSTLTAPSYLIHLSADSAGKPSGGSWTNSSDKRLKVLKGNYTKGLADLEKLQPILFEWNGKGGITPDGIHAGFVAQDVEKVAPEMISYIRGEIDGIETDIYQLNTSDLPLMLRNAVIDIDTRLKVIESKLT
jgi:hypothetical protein